MHQPQSYLIAAISEKEQKIQVTSHSFVLVLPSCTRTQSHKNARNALEESIVNIWTQDVRKATLQVQAELSQKVLFCRWHMLKPL